MDVTNYNVGLANNRSKYQKTLDEAKAKHKDEMIRTQDHADFNFKKLQKDKIREKTKIEQDFSVKLKDDQKKLHKEVSENKLENSQNLSNQRHQAVKKSMKDKEVHHRELSEIKEAFEGSKDNIPQEKFNDLERKLNRKDNLWMQEITKINKSNDEQLEDIHKTFIQQKKSLVKNSDHKVDSATKTLKKTYADRTEKNIDGYEKRIQAKTRENENLIFRLNTLSKKLATRFSKELNNQLEQKDVLLRDERLAMKKRLEDKDVNNDLTIAKIRRQNEAKLHEISLRNNKENNEIVQRFQKKIDHINETNKKDVKAKVGFLVAKHDKLKQAHKLEIVSLKEYQDQQQQRMEDRLANGKSTGVRVVSG